MRKEFYIEPTKEIKDFCQNSRVEEYEVIYPTDSKEGKEGKKIWKFKTKKRREEPWHIFEQDFDPRYFE